MKNILTIDFDIIMAPSINLYNDQVGMDEPLQNLIDEYSSIAFLPANLYIYEYLTRIIIQATKNASKVYFISDHSQIVDIIEDKPNIFNVDHHHDCGYEVDNWKIPFSTPKCGNWVKYLKDKKMINEYTWFHNDNSIEIPEDGEYYIDRKIVLKDSDLETLANEIDTVVICGSFEWIPPMYFPLFLNWKTICEELNNRENTLEVIDNF